MENESSQNSFDDNSSNVNLGLINIESKNKSDTEIQNPGLSVREYVEIAVVIIIALGALCTIYRYFKQRRAKSVLKKKNNLKDILVSATGPGQGMFVKTINQQIPMKEMNQNPQEENLERQLVPVRQQKSNQILPINVARMPIFPNFFYN